MAMFFEFLPIVAFFVALKFSDVYVATGVSIAATLVAALYQKKSQGKIAPMTLISAALMVVFGGLTIALHDEVFVKWKPTILMGLFAIAFFGSRFIGDKPLAQRMLGKAIEADRPVWLRVNDGLALFFLASGALNLWVAYNFSTDAWATFKLFGLLGLNVVAMVLAIAYLSKRGKVIAQPAPERAD
jgi:intracellular septation protein